MSNDYLRPIIQEATVTKHFSLGEMFAPPPGQERVEGMSQQQLVDTYAIVRRTFNISFSQVAGFFQYLLDVTENPVERRATVDWIAKKSANELAEVVIRDLKEKPQWLKPYIDWVRGQRAASLAKHYGPGPHPDGSPQSVHGQRGGQLLWRQEHGVDAHGQPLPEGTSERPEFMVGITGHRGQDDPEHFISNTQNYKDLRKLVDDLEKVVDDVLFAPARGGWQGGWEPSSTITYNGNGEALRLLAEFGIKHNQDAVLIVKAGGNEKSFDIELTKGVDGKLKQAEKVIADAGLGGWTWLKLNGKSTIRLCSVPEWGANVGEEQIGKLIEGLKGIGLEAKYESWPSTATLLTHPRYGGEHMYTIFSREIGSGKSAMTTADVPTPPGQGEEKSGEGPWEETPWEASLPNADNANTTVFFIQRVQQEGETGKSIPEEYLRPIIQDVSVAKHGGPGPHAGTGTPQAIHSGKMPADPAWTARTEGKVPATALRAGAPPKAGDMPPPKWRPEQPVVGIGAGVPGGSEPVYRLEREVDGIPAGTMFRRVQHEETTWGTFESLDGKHKDVMLGYDEVRNMGPAGLWSGGTEYKPGWEDPMSLHPSEKELFRRGTGAQLTAEHSGRQVAAAMRHYMRWEPRGDGVSFEKAMTVRGGKLTYTTTGVEGTGLSWQAAVEFERRMEEIGWRRERGSSPILHKSAARFVHTTGQVAEWTPKAADDKFDFTLRFLGKSK